MALPVERLGNRVIDNRTNVQFLADEIDRHEGAIRMNARIVMDLRNAGLSSGRTESQIARSLDALETRENHMAQELAREAQLLATPGGGRDAFLDSQLSMEINGQLTRLTKEGIGELNGSMHRRGLVGGVRE